MGRLDRQGLLNTDQEGRGLGEQGKITIYFQRKRYTFL